MYTRVHLFTVVCCILVESVSTLGVKKVREKKGEKRVIL